MLDFLKNISPTELIIIVVILVVLFGSKIIVGVAKTGGETFKEIKKIHFLDRGEYGVYRNYTYRLIILFVPLGRDIPAAAAHPHLQIEFCILGESRHMQVRV